jgi:hypothetical protein
LKALRNYLNDISLTITIHSDNNVIISGLGGFIKYELYQRDLYYPNYSSIIPNSGLDVYNVNFKTFESPDIRKYKKSDKKIDIVFLDLDALKNKEQLKFSSTDLESASKMNHHFDNAVLKNTISNIKTNGTISLETPLSPILLKFENNTIMLMPVSVG